MYLFINNKSKKIDNYINFRNIEIKHKGKYLVVEKYIKKISSNFYRDISDWHNKFSNLNSKIENWWLYPYTRITAWHPYNLSNLIKSFIICDLIKIYNLKNIKIDNIDNKSIKYIEDILKLKKKSRSKKFSKNKFIYLKKIFILVSRYLIFILKFIFHIKEKRTHNYRYLFISFDLRNNTKKYDHFYGDIKKFNNKFRNNFKILYLKFKNFEKNDFNYYNWLNYEDIFWISKEYFKSLFIIKKIKFNKLKLKGNKLNYLSSYFCKNFIRNIFLNDQDLLFEIIILRSLSNYLKSNNIQKLIYPFENKPIECSILKGIKLSKSKTISLAYLHANYSLGHISINNYYKYNKIRPNFFLSKNIFQKKRFINKFNWKNSNFINIGNLRYSKEFNNKIIQNNFVFITGYGFELINFAEWCKEMKTVFNKFNLFIKPYPHAWFNDQNNAFRILNNYKIKYQLIDNISDAIKKCKIVLFCSTSAGLEFCNHKRHIIHLNLDRNHFINAIENYNTHEYFSSFNNPYSLSKFLMSYNFNKDKSNLIRNQKKYFKSSFGDINLNLLDI